MNQILHFGPGNFFRAHIADFTQQLGGWTVTGVSLRSAHVRDGLAKQNNIYTLDVQQKGPHQISVIDNIVVGMESPETVLGLVADWRIPVITATVTEKGYCLRPDGRLDLTDPQIVHDISSGTPTTFIGFLARGLAKRAAPVTILSCDNRIANGDALAKAVSEFQAAAQIKAGCEVSFPNTMVDRITPATTKETIEKTGDAMAVTCEPYKEWVIEDRFVATRPNWPGVQWVTDVAPHEMRKLRLLNGAHSFLAYSGILAGYEYVHEAISDPRLRVSTDALMEEAAATLPLEIQHGVEDYTENLLVRFDNIHVKHRLRQIAMDGSQKIPYRLLDSIRSRQAMSLSSPQLCAGFSAWLRFIRAEAAEGRALDDPLAAQLVDAVNSNDPISEVLSLLGATDLTSQFSG